jgi:hypothetical protein
MAVTRPASVQLFEISMYLACAVAVVSLPYTQGSLPGIRFLAMFLWIGFVTFVVWMTARRRKNWGRWLLFSLFVLETAYFVYRARSYLAYPVLGGIHLVITALEAAAYGFVFTGASRAWFAGEDPIDVTVF